MQICRIGPGGLQDALELVWEVFEQYEAPDYEEMGVKTFRHFIDYTNMVEKVNQGEMRFWGCYINNYLVGVIALRTGQHISLLFVRGKFHRLGIGKMLLDVVVNVVASEHPEVPAVTVNSSPFAVKFYERMGFTAMGGERQENGIRFTSMKRKLE